MQSSHDALPMQNIDNLDFATAQLFAALKNKNAVNIPYWIKQGAQLGSVNEKGETAMEYARRIHYWKGMEAIALSEAANENDTGLYGKALFTAVKEAKHSTIEILLAANSPLDYCLFSTLNWCLHQAVINGDEISLELLLQYGGKINCLNRNNQTPLDLAKQLGKKNCITILEFYLLKKQSIEEQCQTAINLFDSMCDGRVQTKNLHYVINEFHLYYHYVINKYLEELSEKRKLLKLNKNLPYLLQIVNPGSPLAELNKVIENASLLLHASQLPPQPYHSWGLELLNDKEPLQRDIKTYIRCKQRIDDYILRIYILLTEVDIAIQLTWEKNSLLMWKKSMPQVIKNIKLCISKLTEQSSCEEILRTYDAFIKIFNTIPSSGFSPDSSSDKIDEDLKSFYQKVELKNKSLTFLSMGFEENKCEVKIIKLV
jgi:hypothetical protein